MIPIEAKLVSGLVFDLNIKGCCLELGRQTIRFNRQQFSDFLTDLDTNESRSVAVKDTLNRLKNAYKDNGTGSTLSDEIFFKSLGFEDVISVDLSSYQEASCKHDLNIPGLSKKLNAPVDFIIEAGTAEHIFHLPNYLENICESLSDGGVVVHLIPSQGYLDHGFYQFSPTVFFDFYIANRFELLDIVLLHTSADDWTNWKIHRYVPGEYRLFDRTRFAGEYVMLAVAARKRSKSTCNVIPQQNTYRNRPDWEIKDGRTKTDFEDSKIIGELKRPFAHVAIEFQDYYY